MLKSGSGLLLKPSRLRHVRAVVTVLASCLACGIDSRDVRVGELERVALPGETRSNGADSGAAREGTSGQNADAGRGAEAAESGSGETEREPTVEVPTCEAASMNEIFRLLREDILLQPSEARPFSRYLTLSNRVAADTCSDQLALHRVAMSQALNMLSIAPEFAAPTPIDPAWTIYRLDLRAYGWARELQVAGVNHRDAWQALAAASPVAMPFIGPDADVVAREAQTSVPVLTMDYLIRTATSGALYYPLIGVEPGASVDRFFLDALGVDVAAQAEGGEAYRAGRTGAAQSRDGILIERLELGVRDGALWQNTYVAEERGEDLFTDPLAPLRGNREVIFTLENGMFAYVIADEAGDIVDSSELVVDALTFDDFRQRAPVSCSRCHYRGLVPVVDEVRPYLESNAPALGTSVGDLARIRALYPAPREIEVLAARDDATFQRPAMERAGVSIAGGDPLHQVFLPLDDDVNLALAASELAVTQEVLRTKLPLVPALAPLGAGGSIERAAWTQRYRAILCYVHEGARNRPEPGACVAAIGADEP